MEIWFKQKTGPRMNYECIGKHLEKIQSKKHSRQIAGIAAK